MAGLERDLAAAYVDAPLNYTSRESGKAVLYEFERGSSTHKIESHVTRVTNARPLLPELSLERNGFTLVRHQTKVTDFYDLDQVKSVYFPEAAEIVKQLTGAQHVLVFGEALRTEGPEARSDRLPARNAHVDFNLKTVRWFVELLAGAEEAERLLQRRCVLINLWRPVKPIERTPLAVCDARTIVAGDLMLGEIGTKPGDEAAFRMEGFNVSYNPDQRWFYFPRMQTDEVLVFKLCDSDPDGRQWTAHTAFDDPGSAPDAPVRESLEVRTISFL